MTLWKMAGTLKSKELVVFPLYTILLNFLIQLELWLVLNQIALLRFLPLIFSSNGVNIEYEAYGSDDLQVFGFSVFYIVLIFSSFDWYHHVWQE